MDDTLSPTPATTAEEAMVSSQEEGAVGGSAGDTGETAEGEEPGEEAEAWAAALPPVSFPLYSLFILQNLYSVCVVNIITNASHHSVAGVGAYHQTGYKQPEEDKGPAPSI